MSLENYTKVTRYTGEEVWLHKSKPVWVVEYLPTLQCQLHYQAYQAVEHVPAGSDPWTVNNRRIGGSHHGFKTLEEAAAAGDAA